VDPGVLQTRIQDENEHTKVAQQSYNSEKCSNLYHSESNARMRGLGVLECSRGSWCTIPYA
jgi:hypothetical protein